MLWMGCEALAGLQAGALIVRLPGNQLSDGSRVATLPLQTFPGGHKKLLLTAFDIGTVLIMW